MNVSNITFIDYETAEKGGTYPYRFPYTIHFSLGADGNYHVIYVDDPVIALDTDKIKVALVPEKNIKEVRVWS